MSLDLNSIVPQFNIKMAISRHKTIYQFENFRLDAGHLMLYQNEQEILLAPKVIETLLVLVERCGEVLSKDELMKLVWTDSIVEEGNLSQNLYLLRKTLGEGKNGKPLIETFRRRGYRFNGEVRRIEVEKKISLSADSPSPFLPVSSSQQGAVVALADWRHETDKNQPEEANGQSAKFNLAPTNPVIKSKPKYRAFALAALLIGAIGLGFYFFYARKTSSGVDGKKSIAVLPLKPINAANRDELFEVGIADSLILRLSSMKGFIVRPLSATRKYADIEQDPLAAGKEQQVDYVLAANYQLAGGKIRVTAQLFNVASGQIEEPFKIEKDAGDFFAMQDAIAGEVGTILAARFATSSNSPKSVRGTTNEEAYRLYWQGRNLIFKRTAADSRKAVEYFQEAVRLDPNFARAYSGMAHAYIASGNFGGGLPREEYAKAKTAVTKALELDNNLAEAYTVSGETKVIYEWDYPAAEKDFLRALELDPNSDLAHEQYGSYLANRGRFDEALAEIKTALEIDPNSLQNTLAFGRILYLARRYDEAITQLRHVIEVNNDAWAAYGWLWTTYEMKGDNAGAYEWFIKMLNRTSPERSELFQKIYETAGWQGVRLKNLELEKLNEQKPSGNYYRLARLCVLIGDKEQAFEYLNKAIEKGHGQLGLLNVEPAFDLLRDDPRFDELVGRVGLK